MTIGELIYRVLIGPLELFFEVIFVIADRHVSNPAYAIIMLSLAMNFLVLPLYRRADVVQAEERDRENAMAPWVKHIKKTFKGDERFMILQAYYREKGFKPTDSLKGSVSLLLEIPFFIAAYHFLSNLQILKGASFGPITDLGSPDALISLSSTTLNLLPILMTLINVVSAAIYMRGFPLKSKIQMYGVAVIFLVFLYKSPAGLVFYWTLNNIFSLIKNLFYKLKNPSKVLNILSSITGACLLLAMIAKHPNLTVKTRIFIYLVIVALQIPIILSFRKKPGNYIRIDKSFNANMLFYISCGILTVLTGILIPSAVINASTAEFIDIVSYTSPFWLIVSSCTIAVGAFLVWFRIFYSLASSEGKQVMALVMVVAAMGGLVNYMFFGTSFGNFSADFIYDKSPKIGLKNMAFNMLIMLLVVVVVIVVWKLKKNVLPFVAAVVCLALVCMSALNLIGINKSLAKDKKMIEAAINSKPEITLSKKGKNVIVLMMDRQIGSLVPYLINEKPELEKQFDGFTYYHNAISFGSSTNTGSPAIYGGYDYTPDNIIERKDESLKAKQNEALKVMPELFGNAGYDVTICEPTYAGYSWIPDLSIFNDHPEYKVFLANGKFSIDEYGYTIASEKTDKTRKRNIFCYSLFRISPAVLQKTLYEHGNYNAQASAVGYKQTTEGMSVAHGFNNGFMKAYAVLYNLPGITTVNDSTNNTFLMMSNDTPHEPTVLKEPEYVPAQDIDNTEFDSNNSVKKDKAGNSISVTDEWSLHHYQVNMAAMLQLGKWFDYMRDNGVYDNTRIIIVSDHGSLFGTDNSQFLYYTNHNNKTDYLDAHQFNCVLMYKDYNAKGFTTNETLSTNADVPFLATQGLIDNAVNPQTNNRLQLLKDYKKPINCLKTFDWDIKKNNGNVFIPGDWFSLKRGSNIFYKDSWEYLGYK